MDQLLIKSLITEIHLPASLEMIREDTFFARPGLRSIDLPAVLWHIHAPTFGSLDGQETLTLPATVKPIGKHTFCNCRKLTLLFPAIRTASRPTGMENLSPT